MSLLNKVVKITTDDAETETGIVVKEKGNRCTVKIKHGSVWFDEWLNVCSEITVDSSKLEVLSPEEETLYYLEN